MLVRCSKCGRSYPRTKEYFYTDKRRKDRLVSECKKCTILRTLKYAKQNSEKHRKDCLRYYHKYKNTVKGQATLIVAKIKSRCYNPKNNVYSYYGGRGVKVCFTKIELLNWLQQNNINPQGLEIHRINNNGNYSLDNIMFLTDSEHIALHNKERTR